MINYIKEKKMKKKKIKKNIVKKTEKFLMKKQKYIMKKTQNIKKNIMKKIKKFLLNKQKNIVKIIKQNYIKYVIVNVVENINIEVNQDILKPTYIKNILKTIKIF